MRIKEDRKEEYNNNTCSLNKSVSNLTVLRRKVVKDDKYEEKTTKGKKTAK